MVLADSSTLSPDKLRTHVDVMLIAAVTTTVLFWEYLVTLTRERDLFWRGLFREENIPNETSERATRISTPERRIEQALFFVNRYITPLGHVPTLWIWFWDTSGVSQHKIEKICGGLHLYHQIFVVVVQFYVAVMMTMRISRLYRLRPLGSNSWIRRLLTAGASHEPVRSVLLVCIGTITTAVGVGCWAILSSNSSESTPYYSPTGCPVLIESSKAKRYAIAWTGLTAFDALAFCLTIYHAKAWYEENLGHMKRPFEKFLNAILRDGALFFGVLVMCNLSTIFTYVYGQAFIKGSPAIFTNVLSSILMSRLFFRMQEELNKLKLRSRPRSQPQQPQQPTKSSGMQISQSGGEF